MDRALWLGVLALAGALAGCTPAARYVEKGADGGVVAIPERSDDWPTFYRSKADAMIAGHVGPEFEVTEEWSEKTGECCAPRCALKRAADVGGDPTEWRIRYRRTPRLASAAE